MANSAGDDVYNKIDTFVFFDLETTGLICGSRMPRITEMAMVATSRDSLRRDQRNKLALPRILHKLTIPVCPKQPIDAEASFITNLWNDTLEHVKPFDESTYNLMMQFIERLPGVVCFIAHNGNRYDYPVLLSELDKIEKSIPDKILCVDTIQVFKEFFSEMEPVTPQTVTQSIPLGRDEVDEEELTKSLECKELENSSLCDDNWNDALYSVLDNYEKGNRESTLSTECGRDVLDSISKGRTVCDYAAPSDQKSPKSMQAANEKTPESQIIRNSRIPSSGSPSKNLNSARKQLNFGDSRPKNFKLDTIYTHMIGCEPDAQHCAEADCITMLRCICQIGSHFAEWADSNAVSLNLFKKKVVASANK